MSAWLTFKDRFLLSRSLKLPPLETYAQMHEHISFLILRALQVRTPLFHGTVIIFFCSTIQLVDFKCSFVVRFNLSILSVLLHQRGPLVLFDGCESAIPYPPIQHETDEDNVIQILQILTTHVISSISTTPKIIKMLVQCTKDILFSTSWSPLVGLAMYRR